MKLITPILAITLLALVPLTFVQAQSTPSSSPAATQSRGSSATAAARTDVYHVLFAKAAPGKAAQLADFLKTPDPEAPMPGHSILLRHQEGDAWDYALIEHLGTKATVDSTPNAAPPAMRDLIEWHNDTFVNGPAWAEFARAVGMGDSAAAKSDGSVYVVSVYRAIPGHRDQLEKFLSEAPAAASRDTSSGNVLMQHLEGGPWNYLTIARYNSWQDFATSDRNSAAQTAKGQGGWFQLREHISFHTDTLADRVAP